MRFTLLLITLAIFLWGCERVLPEGPAEEEVLDGSMEGLTLEQQRIFLADDEAFSEMFSPESGLGPIFVAPACASCHTGDGKGHPSTTLTRFGRFKGDKFNHLLYRGGSQLQNRVVPGFTVESIPAEATGVTRLVAPSVTGLGLLASVPDQDLLDLVTQQKQQGLVSGEVNYIDPPEFFIPQDHHIPNGDGQYIGRFGKKATAVDLLHQTVNAYKQDMGITSDFDLEDPVNFAVSSLASDGVADPEVAAATVNNVVFYLETLKAPIQRDPDDPQVMAGKQLFIDIQCGSCHRPTLFSGNSNIAALASREFHPYTDLLLHDMGPELDDGDVDVAEESSEWRTPPLWGLGLAADAQGGDVFLMHDGRARSITEAIMLHGGEASFTREAFTGLDESQKQDLIKFLESL